MATYDKEEKKVILSSEDKQALGFNKTDVANRTIYQIINGTLDGYNPNKDYIQ